MKKYAVRSFLFSLLPLLVPAVGISADHGFVETSEEILEQLTETRDFGATRSFVVAEEPTRSITVRVKEQGQEQNKQVIIKENSSVRVARLKVEFDVDSARLRPASHEILDQLAVALADVRLVDRQICIKGHTDSDGSEDYNLNLSYLRAGAVRDSVVARHHLNQSQLFVVGYGEQMPLVADTSPTNKQRNRRVEISLGCPEVSEH